MRNKAVWGDNITFYFIFYLKIYINYHHKKVKIPFLSLYPFFGVSTQTRSCQLSKKQGQLY